MESLAFKKIQLIVYGLPLLIILSSIAIALSPLLKQYPSLAIGITYDLTLTTPLLFLLLARKRKISKIRVIPIFIVGTVIATYLLPLNEQKHLNIITTYIVPLVEFVLTTIVVSKVYRGLKSFDLKYSSDSDDMYIILKRSVADIFGDNWLNKFLASEIGVFYYAFFAWKKRRTRGNEFTNYKDNASIALAGAFLMVIFIETYAFHVFLIKWSSVAAWTLTITSIYTAFIIFGHIRALIKRPSILTDKKLILKNGLIADISINLDEIDKIEICNKKIESEDLRIGNLGLSKESTNHNVALYFNSPQTIEKMYGFASKCDLLLVYIDNKNKFVDKVNDALSPKKHFSK